ncbi:MAG: glycosyltransferase family 2 protein [Butyrivibrio sp.]|nr:glycosyltransferase family 2 protein [Butyrivibrio sp.]
MKTDALVSVVIPAYNSEEYISGCLEATISQTYSNIEILIVDNGSDDSTVDTCREYAERDSRIRTFSVLKKGVSVARNFGIDNSNGKYIVFFDSDDRPERDLIENYLNALEEWQNKTVALVTCGMFFDNIFYRNVLDKVSILESQSGFIEGENYLLKRNYAAVLAWLKLFNFVTNKIYDNDVIKHHGIRFDEYVNIGEDLKFNLDYLNKCEGYIGMINKPMYHYIKRTENSLSFTYHESDVEDTKTIYRRFLDWESQQKGVTEDNLLVIKSIYITDWISRLSTMSDYYKENGGARSVIGKLSSEVGCNEFQSMLKQVYKAKKISTIRYMALRTRRYEAFCLLREIYQKMKK